MSASINIYVKRHKRSVLLFRVYQMASLVTDTMPYGAHLSPRTHNLSSITASFYTLYSIIKRGPIKDQSRLSAEQLFSLIEGTKINYSFDVLKVHCNRFLKGTLKTPVFVID